MESTGNTGISGHIRLLCQGHVTDVALPYTKRLCLSRMPVTPSGKEPFHFSWSVEEAICIKKQLLLCTYAKLHIRLLHFRICMSDSNDRPRKSPIHHRSQGFIGDRTFFYRLMALYSITESEEQALTASWRGCRTSFTFDPNGFNPIAGMHSGVCFEA